jgi:hypothetical protein
MFGVFLLSTISNGRARENKNFVFKDPLIFGYLDFIYTLMIVRRCIPCQKMRGPAFSYRVKSIARISELLGILARRMFEKFHEYI